MRFGAVGCGKLEVGGNVADFWQRERGDRNFAQVELFVARFDGEVHDPRRDRMHQAAFRRPVEVDGEVIGARLDSRDVESTVRLGFDEPLMQRVEVLAPPSDECSQESFQPRFQSNPFPARNSGGSIPGRRATR